MTSSIGTSDGIGQAEYITDDYWAMRAERLGASDVFDACGGDPVGLYLRKVAGDTSSPSWAMRRGHALEPTVCRLLEQETGLAVRRQQVPIRNSQYGHLVALIDAELSDGSIAELKTVGQHEAHRLGLEESGSTVVPDRWYIQCQTHMLLTGLRSVRLACLVLSPVVVDMLLAGADEAETAAAICGTGDFRVYDVVASDSRQAWIEARTRLWHDHFRRREPPFALAFDPLSTAKYWRPTGEIFEADDELAAMVAEWRQAKSARNEAGKQADRYDAMIRAAMQGRTALFPDGSALELREVTRSEAAREARTTTYTVLKMREAADGQRD